MEPSLQHCPADPSAGPPSGPEDREAVRQVLNGRREAYRTLVLRYQSRILRLCESLLHNRTEAEDAAQEVFLKAYLSLGRFRADSSFFTWLYRIASNTCLDLLRARKRKPSESWDALLEKEGESIQELLFADGKADPARALVASDLAEHLLSFLKEDYRLVLTLREGQGLSYLEIAQVLDCSVDSVKARLRRARVEIGEKMRHFSVRKDVQSSGGTE